MIHADYALTASADLAPVIRAARKRMGMTQQEFADAAGVGRRFLSELENGKPSLEFDKVPHPGYLLYLHLILVLISQSLAHLS